ncbi:MAG: DUF3368 domain-containing protein [Chloroflexi bacterium]|nr:DUF3368 domain-containing protein [Chloroflexota bacterium]
MSVVSDTGPLIALARINRLDVLDSLFGQVYVPSLVAQELVALPGPDSRRLRVALDSWLEVREPTAPMLAPLRLERRLSHADQSVIRLADELRLVLLMDERAGRSAAQRLGIPVAGVAEVIRRAKYAGLVTSVRATLSAMVSEGYWLAPTLIERVATQAGE